MYKNILGELLLLHIDSNNFEFNALPLKKHLLIIIFLLPVKKNSAGITIRHNRLIVMQIQ